VHTDLYSVDFVYWKYILEIRLRAQEDSRSCFRAAAISRRIQLQLSHSWLEEMFNIDKQQKQGGA